MLATRRRWLKGLSGLLAGTVLAGPLQALLGRATPAAASPLTGGGDSPFVGEIILAGFSFAPKGYARCDGQLLSISQNTALFSLLGTYYGGDGKSNFTLPNLNGCVPVGTGQGPGLSLYDLGQTGGVATYTLQTAEIPAHTHSVALTYSTALGTTGSPGGAYLASNGSGLAQYDTTNTGRMATGDTGTAQPHNNLQPYLVLSYYIALQGIYPPRT
ncbi:MAG: tail fiber protein [Hymenobacter sp.]